MRLSALSTLGSATVLVATLSATPISAGEEAKEGERFSGAAADVAAVERAFAATMADRDLESFASFLSEETVFISGPSILRGKKTVSEAWSLYFVGPDAPFSWEPETVEVLESGALALSTGPVRNVEGTVVGIFTSIWRQEAPGVWRIVFDRGTPACGE
jgi:ketosteroid isomerase-like protein